MGMPENKAICCCGSWYHKYWLSEMLLDEKKHKLINFTEHFPVSLCFYGV